MTDRFISPEQPPEGLDRIEAARALAENGVEGSNAAHYSAALGLLAEARAEGFAGGMRHAEMQRGRDDA